LFSAGIFFGDAFRKKDEVLKGIAEEEFFHPPWFGLQRRLISDEPFTCVGEQLQAFCQENEIPGSCVLKVHRESDDRSPVVPLVVTLVLEHPSLLFSGSSLL